MRLPFALDHINLWAISDGPGWTLVDTGLNSPETMKAWEQIVRDDLAGRPITRLIVTHMHADHAGLAGWLAERFNCPLWMTRTEYLSARTLATANGTEPELHSLFRKAGWQPHEIDAIGVRKRAIAKFYTPLPRDIRRIRHGDRLEIDGYEWSVLTGGGHSPEHACLYCPQLNLLISGDKILPDISSNVSVDPAEPEGNPVAEWFETLAMIRAEVPDTVLVLPSHGNCFTGLHGRIDRLVNEQQAVIRRLSRALQKPHRVDELFDVLFSRPIARADIPLMSLATGEALAVLNYLIAQGEARSWLGADGVMLYERVRS